MTAAIRAAATALLITTLGACLACQSRSDPEQGAWVTVDGVVRRVGSEPFSQIVVTDGNDEDWYVIAQDELLTGMEHQQVRVRGTLHLRPLVLANGQDLGERRELLDVEVVRSD